MTTDEPQREDYPEPADPQADQPEADLPPPLQSEEPAPEDDIVQPADLPEAREIDGKSVELRTPTGSLTLGPNQKELTAEQRAAFVAIGIDTRADPGIVPHARVFVHMCQTRGLDPYNKEAYLIGRGQGERRKYTMQIGIDGFRNMASSTGRFIRVKSVLWTGQDDDAKAWVQSDDGNGGVVMKRVWWDQWPASRGYPGAAKVVVEHYDDANNVVETEAIADWLMYAPFTDAWDWHPTARGKKVYKTDDEGKPVKELNDMWEKGYAHMLAKCAEALAYRRAFPRRMGGIYTHEEMHRADQMERDRVEAEVRTARQRAYNSTHNRGAVLTPKVEVETPPPADPDADGGTLSEPISVADLLPDLDGELADEGPPPAPVVHEAPDARDADEEQRKAWLLAELKYQSTVLEHPVSRIAGRAMRALRKNPEDFTAAELLAVVGSMRPATLARLRDAGESATADRYATLGPTDVTDHTLVIGEPEAEPEPEPEDDPRMDADPDVEHEYVHDPEDGTCRVCGLAENLGPHP